MDGGALWAWAIDSAASSAIAIADVMTVLEKAASGWNPRPSKLLIECTDTPQPEVSMIGGKIVAVHTAPHPPPTTIPPASSSAFPAKASSTRAAKTAGAGAERARTSSSRGTGVGESSASTLLRSRSASRSSAA